MDRIDMIVKGQAIVSKLYDEIIFDLIKDLPFFKQMDILQAVVDFKCVKVFQIVDGE